MPRSRETRALTKPAGAGVPQSKAAPPEAKPATAQTTPTVSPRPTPDGSRGWTFLSNHGHLLVAVGRDPHARVSDLAAEVGITLRAAQAILLDLEQHGYLTRIRVGRRTEYHLHPERPFRHPAEADRPVGHLLAIFSGDIPGDIPGDVTDDANSNPKA